MRKYQTTSRTLKQSETDGRAKLPAILVNTRDARVQNLAMCSFIV